MKKIIILIFLLSNFIGGAQCPAPSNINLINNIAYLSTAELSWTENGTANTWDITVIPDFFVGATLPANPTFSSVVSNPFTITGISPSYGCYAFFVRSVCSATDFSPWVAVGTLGCSITSYNYLASLSNESFTLINDTSGFTIAPNPTKSNVQIKSNSKIDTITVFDSLGKIILIQTQNNNEINVEHFSKGIYFVKVSSDNKTFYNKLIKE